MDEILQGMEDKFNDMYSKTGRPSVPPERLLKAKVFGWTKTTGLFRKSRFRGVARTDFELQFTIGTLNLVRMAKIRRNEQKEAQQVLPIPVCA